MADLVITAASVVAGVGAIQKAATAGGTVTAGQPIYLDGSGDVVACDADVLASAACAGIALNGASDGQPVDYISQGLLTIGATVIAGEAYYVTATTGGLGAWAEVGVGDYASQVCLGMTTTVVWVQPKATGVVRAA